MAPSAPNDDSRDSFLEWLDQVNSGRHGSAVTEVWRRYSERLIALARTKLDRRVRAKADPEDVVQSVFKSFHRRQNDRPFDVAGWQDLWSILVVITVRKCYRRINEFRTRGRDISRERRLDWPDDESAEFMIPLASEPTPEEAAILAETLEQLFEPLSPLEREAISLRLQGFTVPEISRQVYRAERTVHRIIDKVRKKLQTSLASESE